MKLFLTLIAIIQATLAITPAEDQQLQTALAEVKEMDRELESITEHQTELERSSSARRDEIISLQTRYPGIALTGSSNVREIYRALYEYRMARGRSVLGIAERKRAATQSELCDRARELEKLRAQVEASDAYRRATLDERIRMRHGWDDLLALKGECPE